MSLGPCHWHLHCPFPKPWAIWTLLRSLGRKVLGGVGGRLDTWKLGSETTGRKKVPTVCCVYLGSGWTRWKWLGFGRQVPAKVTLETLGNSRGRKDLYLGATPAAHHGRREPGGRGGLAWPWPEAVGRWAAGAPPPGLLALGLGGLERGAAEASWGRASGLEGGPFLCQGICAARRGAPLPRPLGGGAFPAGPGPRWAWAWSGELAGARPSSEAGPPILAAAPPARSR